MNKAIIIEDEKAVSSHLIAMLRELEPDMQVKAVLSSVDDSITYLQQYDEVDIIFSDVQLSDGLSFAIFSQLKIDVPIIFITGYDQFMINAFEHNSIDYLLKPVAKEDLCKALNKYKRLQKHYNNAHTFMYQLLQGFNGNRKTRIIVKKGLEHISLLLDDVVLFFTENKIVYVLDKSGKKYITDKNLADLEQELDAKLFFRVNRQYLVNINYIKSFKAYERVKLQVDLTVPDDHHFIIVSQETAPLFRKWMSES